MIGLIIVLLIMAYSFIGWMGEELSDAFNDPNWIDIKDWEL